MIDLSKPTRRAIAIHEAGHVVVSLWLKVPFIRATIKSERKLLGHVEHGMTRDKRKLAAVCLGGYIAEFIAAGRPLTLVHTRNHHVRMRDLPDLHAAFGALRGPDWIENVREVQQWVRAYLSKNWGMVEIVAHLLLKRGSLTARQLTRELEAM